MMKRCIKPLIVSSLLLTAAMPSYAVCPTSGPVVALTGAALKDLNNLRDTFKSTVVKPVMMQVDISFGNIQNAITSRDMQILEAINEAAALSTINRTQIDQVNSELQASYDAALETELKLFDNELMHNDGIQGGSSDRYFRAMCAENKVKKGSFGRGGYLERKDVMKEMLAVNDVKATEAKDTRSVAREVQMNHLENYCSSSDVEEGVCKEAAKIPYADTLSFVALNPMNLDSDGIDPETGYQTQYTYSEFELQAAQDYYENILRMGALRRPSPATAEANPVLAVRHNQLQAGLSLANYSFSTSINNRVAQDPSTSVPMSRFDTLAYMMTKKSQEIEEVGSTQTKKGYLMELMNQIALKNYFEHEKAMYYERINNMTAALISIKENSPDRLDYLDSLR